MTAASRTFMLHMLNTLIPMIALLLTLPLAGCSRSTKDILVLTKSLKKEVLVSTAVPSEFGTFAAASMPSFWVEGQVQNVGSTDVRNVLLSFACSYGKETKVLTAEVDLIPAGKTVPYKTRPFESRFELQLSDEAPEIRVAR